MSGHVSTYNSERGGSDLKVETVVSRSLDDIMSAYGDEDYDFLKMDCEGAEYDILPMASRDTLRKVRRMAIETHAGRGEELRDLLISAGFEIVQFIGGRIGLVKAVRV